MKKIILNLSEQDVSIGGWIMSFIGILFVRFILESLSSPTRNLQIPSNIEALAHFTLFWICLTFGLILIIGLFSKKYLESAKLALFGLPIIWSAPMLDILISGGRGFHQSYILDTGKNLLYDLFTFFGPNLNSGATYGLRIEMLLVLIFLCIYLKSINTKPLKIILCVMFVYLFGFFLASWPAILYTITHPYSDPLKLDQTYLYFYNLIINSNISHNTIYNGMNSVSLVRFSELSFDKLSSQILYILSCIMACILFWNIDKDKFHAITNNIRVERVGSYISLLLCGLGFAYINKLGLPLSSVDLLGITCLIISWVSLWMYAVHNNDIEDIEIDKISNKERPLVKGELDVKTMKDTGSIWLAVALFGSYCAGFYQFYFSLVYLFCSYIYSNPPLRLRRYPIIPSFIIGIASLATVLSGFFFMSVSKQILTFPILMSIGIIIMAALAINVKDMKDIEGDRKNGIMTLPVMLGDSGPRVVAILFSLSFLLVPYFLSTYILYVIAVPVAVIGYRFVVKKPYKEEPIFRLRFIFLMLIAIIYGGTIWFLK